jgi:hypothetical protein
MADTSITQIPQDNALAALACAQAAYSAWLHGDGSCPSGLAQHLLDCWEAVVFGAGVDNG